MNGVNILFVLIDKFTDCKVSFNWVVYDKFRLSDLSVLLFIVRI